MREIHDSKQSVALHSWADRIDPLSLQSLQRLARWDRFGGPIAILPDVHTAGDVCVGTVLATNDCVIPAAVGEDLGCGMHVRGLDLDAAWFSREKLERLVADVLKDVPVGHRVHSRPQRISEVLAETKLSTTTLEHSKSWLAGRHLGTLGGGNHFIEVQRDTAGRLWLTVHSGSRGIGAAIATHHAKVAQSHAGPHPKLGVLALNSTAADAFWNDLQWALSFAAENRRTMADRVLAHINASVGSPPREFENFDVAHNLIQREVQPDGRTLVVHRKGAMPAALGSRGIIPGSMATASYIVEGRGNPASYASCSHGAGRTLSRSEARRQISVAELQHQMRHVVFPKIRGLDHSLVEESPRAYKDIKEILAQQSDLVKPILRLEPLAVIKG